METDTNKGHILLKAATTVATEQGQFTAVISTASVDREKDIVEPDAMVKALAKWPRQIPLAWEHDASPEGIFGSMDPQSVKAMGLEVLADGQVDMESKAGSEAWRSIKSRSLGFSFGYLIPEGGATQRKGGGLHIHELDVFEITATRAPINNETRVVSWKSVEASDNILQELQGLGQRLEHLEKKAEEAVQKPEASPVDPLREASLKDARTVLLDGVARKSPKPEPKPEMPPEAEIRRSSEQEMLRLLKE